MNLVQITMTKAKALEIQAEQVKHYGQLRPGLAEAVAAITTADRLQDGIEYPTQVINFHIPRGGRIEALCGVDFGGE